MLRVVVTGGRNFTDEAMVKRALCHLHQTYRIDMLIHGDASGADRLCAFWAIGNLVSVQTCPADWSDISHPDAVVRTGRYGQYDVTAGFRRNQSMIDDHNPNYAVAFPGGSGTNDMVKRIVAADIPLWDLR